MRIAFRTDATSQIGTGHFMRCLTLADELKQRGAQIRFVCRQLPEYLCNMLQDKGYEHVPLVSSKNDLLQDKLAHSNWLGVSQKQDAEDSIHALSDCTWDWIIVDHYALDTHWESLLRQTTKKILVIDDIADRNHDCDILLDQNLYVDMEERYLGKVPISCELLLGPRYALLRDEFRLLHEQVKPREGLVKRILVFFGGVDVDNYTSRAIEALSDINYSNLHVDVVIGSQHSHRKQIETVCAEHRYECHVQTNQMAKLMAAADLTIGAGGSTIWERSCLGLPTFAISTADNQVRQVADMANEGLLYTVELNGDLTQSIKNHLCTLFENNCLRYAISSKSLKIVDGRGVTRVIASMDYSEIKIREASEENLQQLFEWRNHITIREVSRNSEIISWEEHQNWFTTMLSSSDKLLLIGYRDDVPIGVVLYDIKKNECEVSIYIVPGIKKSGLGRDLLQSAERWLVANRPEVNKICALVLASNERSQNLFLGAGYQLESTYFSKRLQKYESCELNEVKTLKYFSSMNITILCTDPNHSIINSLHAWIKEMSSKGHSISLVYDKSQLVGGDILFLVSCDQIINDTERQKYQASLVLHASDLPQGRGWSPHVWSILNGENEITVCLLEASDPVDSGDIWLKTKFALDGHELLPEINAKLFAAELYLMSQAVEKFNIIKPIRQKGEPGAFMSKRSLADSELDPNISIAEQFDLIRVVDTQRYPAFFNYRSKKYLVKIEKTENERY